MFLSLTVHSQNLATIGNGTHNYSSRSTNDIKINSKQFKDVQLSEIELKKNSSNNHIIDVEYKAIRNERHLKKDSVTIIDTKSPRYALSYYLKGITNKGLYVKVDNKGLTNDTVSGFEEAYSHIFDAYYTLPDSSIIIGTQQQVDKSFGKLYIRGILENILSVAPGKKAKEGDIWECVSHCSNNLKSTIKNNYTLKSITASEYRISAVSTIIADTSYFNYDGTAYLLEKTEGNITSEIILDKETGMLRNGTYQVSLKAMGTPLSYEGSTEYSISQPIEINIKQLISKE